MSAESVNIKYDEFMRSCQNSWMIKINHQIHFFPYSLCDLDEDSKEVICPLWLVKEKELESYIVE